MSRLRCRNRTAKIVFPGQWHGERPTDGQDESKTVKRRRLDQRQPTSARESLRRARHSTGQQHYCMHPPTSNNETFTRGKDKPYANFTPLKSAWAESRGPKQHRLIRTYNTHNTTHTSLSNTMPKWRLLTVASENCIKSAPASMAGCLRPPTHPRSVTRNDLSFQSESVGPRHWEQQQEQHQHQHHHE